MFFNTDTRALELSVRELCAIAHKSGSLDARRPRSVSAMKTGSEAHRKLQEKEGPEYRAEMPLCHTETYHDICFTVEGRADGVIEKDGTVTVEEIKTAHGRGFEAGARDDAYSQLRCYAYFLAAARDLSRVTLRMRLFNPETGEVRDTLSEATASELHTFFESLLARVEGYARLEILRRDELIPSVRDIGFPYPNPRAGQTEMAEACFRTVRRGGRLFAQAPTGIGKTMSALYPAVKAVGETLCDRVFYLTAKASTRREAYAAAGKLFASGARLRTVVLYAKEQMCLCEQGCRTGNNSHCNPVDCPFARGYYDRVDGAIFELLSRQNGFPRGIIAEVAKKYRVCPYELSLDLSEQCEIIICDYNYVFDPAVYLRRYFDPVTGERGRYVFLIDEAHNLPDRARDMYSARLSGAPFEAVYARVDPNADADLEADLGGFVLSLRRLSKFCTENRVKNEDGTENGYYLNRAPLSRFHETAAVTREKLDAFLKANPEHPLAPEIGELIRLLRRFVTLTDYYDDRFLTYVGMRNGVIDVQLFCLDPTGIVDACLSRARAAILFSATLTPLDYFADLLGGVRHASTLELPSPYDPAHLCVTVAGGVSTRFEDREKSYRKIAALIAASVSAKAGNYMVYFPSYDYLEKVLAVFQNRYPRVNCIVQQREMSARDREAFLDRFVADEGKLRVGFCVLGGSFSEGVDLPGSRLIGVVVVGVGIPGLSDERNILRDYFENKCERGYDYAYTYPGMNRVLQAAGRVIRREEDRGIVVLIDSRYAEEPYLHLYPAHWEGLVSAGDATSLARRLQLFWKKQENER